MNLAISGVIDLDILSPGLVGNVTASSITLGGPAFGASIERMRASLGESFNITHTYLYDEKIPDCVTFQIEVQNILARWYYTRREPNTAAVIVTPRNVTEYIRIFDEFHKFL